MSITEVEIAEAMRRRPGTDKETMLIEIKKMRLEQRRAKEDDALLHPHESAFDREMRKLAESGRPDRAPTNTAFKAHDSEIILAKAKCGPGATDTELIASIRQRRAWEASHPNWLNEAAARSPKQSHGRPVTRQTSLSEPSQSRRNSGTVELREEGNPGMVSLADMGLR
jgi:hypothetical protein